MSGIRKRSIRLGLSIKSKADERDLRHAIFRESLLRRSPADGDCRNREGSLWHVVERFTNVSISDGIKSYSIAEFSLAMALQEIANTVEAAAELEGKAK